jgi:hypothetical protein
MSRTGGISQHIMFQHFRTAMSTTKEFLRLKYCANVRQTPLDYLTNDHCFTTSTHIISIGYSMSMRWPHLCTSIDLENIVPAIEVGVFAWKILNDWSYIFGGLSWMSIYFLDNDTQNSQTSNASPLVPAALPRLNLPHISFVTILLNGYLSLFG